MAWEYKEEVCECGAELAGKKPIRPVLNVLPDKSIANCPACWRTLDIVEVEPEVSPDTPPEPDPEPTPAPATMRRTIHRASPEPTPAPDTPPEPASDGPEPE